MENGLQIFENAEFGKIRTLEKEGKILFCGRDVASALGYAIPSKAINTHCKGVSKMEVLTNGSKQEMLFITEGDIYRLAAKSELPGAEKFESWIFDEVLPYIRQHSLHVTPVTIENMIADLDFVIKLLTQLKEEQQELKKEIRYLKMRFNTKKM